MQSGEVDRVLDIINSNAHSVHLRDRRTQTALHYASRCGQIDVVQLLLTHGADVHALNKHGHEALAVAVESGQVEAVVHLLEGGGDPNAAGGHYGGTVLHRAVLQRSLRSVDSLLGAGADPNRPDAGGKTPLHEGSDRDWQQGISYPYSEGTKRQCDVTLPRYEIQRQWRDAVGVCD